MTTMRAWLVPFSMSMLVATGCAASSPRADEGARGEPQRIAAIHVSKCGSCHVPVEPGTRSRDELERALDRHQKRLHLTREEWNAMVEYLAAESPIR
jgi:hypothetical protein